MDADKKVGLIFFLAGCGIVFTLLFIVIPHFDWFGSLAASVFGEKAPGLILLCSILLAAYLIGTSLGDAIGRNGDPNDDSSNSRQGE